MGVSSAKSYGCDTLPSQVPVRKMEHENTAEINSLFLDSNRTEISGSRELTAVIRVAEYKNSLLVIVKWFLSLFPSGWYCFV